jgi:hypothetical protein
LSRFNIIQFLGVLQLFNLALGGTELFERLNLSRSSHFESSKNSAKNIRRHFPYKFIFKIGDSDQKKYLQFFLAKNFKFKGIPVPTFSAVIMS